MVAHAHILLWIELLKETLLLVRYRKLYSNFGEYRTINNITFLSADAGWRDVYVILYYVQRIGVALDRQ